MRDFFRRFHGATLGRLSVRERVFLLVGTLLALNALTLIVFVVGVRISGAHYEKALLWYSHAASLKNVEVLVRRQQSALREGVLAGDAAVLRESADTDLRLNEAMGECLRFARRFGGSEAEDFEDLASSVAGFGRLSLETVRLRKSGERERAARERKRAERFLEEELLPKLRLLMGAEEEGSDAWRLRAERVAARVSFFGILIILLSLLFGAGAAWLLSARILGAIRELQEGVVGIGEGDLTRVLQVNGDDEISRLASSFNRMAADLRRQREETVRMGRVMARSEKMAGMGRLAAGIAHEMNNPLAVILGFTQSALRRIKDPDPLIDPLKSIESEALRCRNLVSALLTFSHQSVQRDSEFDLVRHAAGALALIEAHAKLRKIGLVKELPASPLPILGDRDAIERIVMNLADNALDAMPGGGTLSVRLSSSERDGRPEALLDVSDTGMGIPEEFHSKIFEPFFTTKEVGKGTGLGLSLVHEIVARHGGAVSFESAPGRGSKFSVRLPLLGPGPAAVPLENRNG